MRRTKMSDGSAEEQRLSYEEKVQHYDRRLREYDASLSGAWDDHEDGNAIIGAS